MALATSRDEVPVFLPAGHADVFGILTRPAIREEGPAAMLVWGGGAYPTSGRNQVRTRLARRLAASGWNVLRMDYRGIGESSGSPPDFEFRRPPTEDVRAAWEWLHQQGLSPISLVGSCFGARTVLASAEAIPELAGVALIGCPVRDEDHVQTAARRKPLSWYARRAFDPNALKGLARSATRRTYGRWAAAKIKAVVVERFAHIAHRGPGLAATQEWASPRFLRQFGKLVERRVPVLFVYSAGADFYRDFQQARRGMLGRLLEKAGPLATLRVIDTPFNLYADASTQQELIDVLDAWLSPMADESQPRGR